MDYSLDKPVTPELPRHARPEQDGMAWLKPRFLAIWGALVVLALLCALIAPAAVSPATLAQIMPFVAFMAIATMGQALVIMVRGIDLSVPATISLAAAVLLGVSGGSDAMVVPAVLCALLTATLVGTVNGLLVAFLRLNALIVTMASGSVVLGVTLWYRQGLPAEARVPPLLSGVAGARVWGVPAPVLIALVLVLLATVILRRTLIGRRLEIVGTSPRAAFASGIEIMRYQIGAFAAAGFLYGVLAVTLSGFIQNPTLEIGNPYLLAPIAGAVLAGTSMAGGASSMIAVAGAAFFLLLLDQMLKILGLPTSMQMLFQGVAIAAGMYLSELTARGR